jgi:hypothetical protein
MGAEMASKFIETLERIFNELSELKVVTAVGPVKVTLTTGADGRTKTTVETGNAAIEQGIVTIFDLVDGDVTNVVSPELEGNAALRSFHTEQVEKSQAVLKGNITAMIELGKAIAAEIR